VLAGLGWGLVFNNFLAAFSLWILNDPRDKDFLNDCLSGG
jgi:hypothetical protein